MRDLSRNAKILLTMSAIVLLSVLWVAAFFVALWSAFSAARNGGDVWGPLAVIIIILYGAQENINSHRVSSEISSLRADLTSAIALSDASIEALAQAFAEDEAAEKAQWN